MSVWVRVVIAYEMMICAKFILGKALPENCSLVEVHKIRIILLV